MESGRNARLINITRQKEHGCSPTEHRVKTAEKRKAGMADQAGPARPRSGSQATSRRGSRRGSFRAVGQVRLLSFPLAPQSLTGRCRTLRPSAQSGFVLSRRLAGAALHRHLLPAPHHSAHVTLSISGTVLAAAPWRTGSMSRGLGEGLRGSQRRRCALRRSLR
jgi:hypothetical protein